MISFKEFFYFIESANDSVIDVVGDIYGEKIPTKILRNPSPSKRNKLVSDNTSLYKSTELKFILHIPTNNIYFFNGDLLIHEIAARKIGLETHDEIVRESITGQFDVGEEESRISISKFSTDFDYLKANKVNVIQIMVDLFKTKCLTSLTETEIINLNKDFKNIN